jgi:hypothetical protein
LTTNYPKSKWNKLDWNSIAGERLRYSRSNSGLSKAAFENERRAKELAFDEERRVHERELHQQRLARLMSAASADSSGNRHADKDDGDNVIPPEAKEVSLLFPQASQKEIAVIFEGKFDPTNLHKLRERVFLMSKDDDEEVSVSGGRLRAKKRFGIVKDYLRPGVWSASFLEYIAILFRFDKYSGFTHPLINFHGRIIDLSKVYSWEAILDIALTFHREWIAIGLHAQNAWLMQPAVNECL